MGPISEVVTEMMPEQVVQHSLGDPGCSHVGNVPLLTAPLYPARLGGAGVDQHHGLHPLRVSQGVPGQYIGPQTHS